MTFFFDFLYNPKHPEDDMALDGITLTALTTEIRDKCVGGRISRIAEPEAHEILLTIKSGAQQRLILSADPSLPLITLTETNKPSPMTAPGFLMLLRKHLQGGRIVSVTQPGLERAVRIEVEHLNELGDLCRKDFQLAHPLQQGVELGDVPEHDDDEDQRQTHGDVRKEV